MKPSAAVVTIAPIVGLGCLIAEAAPSAWRPTQVLGLAMLVPSLVLITVARMQLGRSFSVAPRATQLVTHGLYSRVRNPIYVLGVPFLAGLILFFDCPAWLALVVPLAVMQFVRAGREAKVLEARFGEDYRRYRAGTWF
jgi:protein-S-isoprenylcysteine O-methyltransferase Ste14